jgi:hypothetical protein
MTTYDARAVTATSPPTHTPPRQIVLAWPTGPATDKVRHKSRQQSRQQHNQAIPHHRTLVPRRPPQRRAKRQPHTRAHICPYCACSRGP